ncbi:YicC/YloC family endoribonuclease [Kordiimonas lacus]|uniref:TIGR00255 family protein n=1 Tax=Kordiimonas lacus TaxID=637679 RepID=A0A1G6WVQ0_9PROT|nr:YicC/YloC family endoribonuclease [Kordiimonas lacus]SDD69968.1 TIGR00255 family protein [Kordiimonas lacus]
MPLNSMTGFARGAGADVGFRWNWEVKSVNNKGLEVRAKLPSFLDGFDLAIKKAVSGMLARGSVYISLNIERDGDDASFVVNEDRLQALIDVAARFSDVPGVEKASIDGLLAIKGVVDLTSRDMTDDERSALEAVLLKDLKTVVTDLKAARADEGARMGTILETQLADIAQLATDARAVSGDRLESMHARFRQQLAKLENIDKPVAEDRIAQELATMTVKADIQEELDRLDSHVVEAKLLLASDQPVGRKLDFLCQEFNREANTLCSKSSDTALTKIGLELKALIDQFREQIQNIE